MEKTAIQDGKLFNEFCDLLAQNILEKRVLSKEDVSLSIRVWIKNNENIFYDCLKSELDKRIDRQIEKVIKLQKIDHQRYLEESYVLKSLRVKKKEANIAKTKTNNEGVKFRELKRFLKDNNYQDILEKYYDFRDDKKLV